MATLPKIRDKVSISSGNKNRSLKDILAPMGAGVEVLKVEAITAPMHNTKATIRVDNSKVYVAEGENQPTEPFTIRAILYNRIDIATILPETISAPMGDLAAVLKELNSEHQCDFTEDDIEVVGNTIKAKATSLGYYSSGTDVGNTVPTDTVSFGVRTLPDGRGDKSQIDRYYYQKIVVSVDGVVYDPEPIESGSTSIPAMDIVGMIEDIFVNHFPLIKVNLLLTSWFEDFYRGQEQEMSAIVELTNLDKTAPKDVTVQLHTLDKDGSYILKDIVNLLPNARLQPNGSTVVDVGVDQYALSEAEVNLNYDPYSEHDLDEEGIGKLFGLNGSTHSVYIDTNPGVGDYFDIELTNSRIGLQNVLRVYRKPYEGGLNDGSVVMFLKNLLETPVTVEHPGFNNGSLVFTKVETETPLDQIMVVPTNTYSDGKRSFTIQLNSDKYTLDLNDTEWTGAAFEILIGVLLESYSAIKQKIDISILEEISSRNVNLYIKNKTAAALDVSIYYKDSDGLFVDIFPPVILEPLGTKGLGYTPDDQITTSNALATDLVNAGLIESITWRGMTHPFELSGVGLGWMWKEKIWRNILVAAASDDNVIDYFHSWSPFKEEFIFNKGKPNEVKFHIEPKQLVDATEVPS